VIAVFTKFDQFKLDIEMKLEDQGCDPDGELDTGVESVFNQRYLVHLRDLRRLFVWSVRILLTSLRELR
jgi:hypothetical protein